MIYIKLIKNYVNEYFFLYEIGMIFSINVYMHLYKVDIILMCIFSHCINFVVKKWSWWNATLVSRISNHFFMHIILTWSLFKLTWNGMVYVSICTFIMKVWKYGRSKNDDDETSESKVTEIVANKFGGPCIANGHGLDTINYPTSRLRKSNLT